MKQAKPLEQSRCFKVRSTLVPSEVACSETGVHSSLGFLCFRACYLVAYLYHSVIVPA